MRQETELKECSRRLITIKNMERDITKDMQSVLDNYKALLTDPDFKPSDFFAEHVESWEFIVTPQNRTFAGAFIKLKSLWGECWLDTFSRLLILGKDGQFQVASVNCSGTYKLDNYFLNMY